MMTSHKWKPISPLTRNGGYDFSVIDSLQRQWTAYRQSREAAEPKAYAAFLERLTRSWAIETGIIEGLYTLDGGVTKTLVMEGISSGLIERGDTNKEPQELIMILEDHQNAARGVYEQIRHGRPITSIAIRQIHQILTTNQATYRAINQFGQWFDAELHHGAFKTRPNSPTRPDGTVHEYCPPEQVDSELDNLLRWYGEYQQDTGHYHPLLTAAWLHHCFTQIHPFEDGNGRVVRTLLTWHLVRERYLPVVVKRDDRAAYIQALESADQGNLVPFVDLLVRLQRRTILEAIGEPEDVKPIGAFDQVLNHIAEQVSRQNAGQATQMRMVNAVAELLRDNAAELLDELADQVVSRLAQAGRTVSPYVIKGGPEEREHWYRHQVVQTANNSGHWANFNESRFFARLALTPASQQPRLLFIVSLHHTGRQLTGVMAATSFALIDHYYDSVSEQIEEGPAQSFIDCTLEPFTFTGEDDADGILSRFTEWTEQSLAIALRQWGEYLT